MSKKKSKPKHPETIEDIEVLAYILGDMGYPKTIIQKIRSGGLYKLVYEEFRSQFRNMITVNMYDRQPITYTTKAGYEFLISE